MIKILEKMKAIRIDFEAQWAKWELSYLILRSIGGGGFSAAALYARAPTRLHCRDAVRRIVRESILMCERERGMVRWMKGSIGARSV